MLVLTAKKDMTHETIDNFRSLAPSQLPGLCNPDLLDTVDDYGDYALLTYNLAEPVPIQSVMDDLEDDMELNILYHIDSFNAGVRGQHCCAYSSPSTGRMYKLNVQSDAAGLVSTLYVHLYESLEIMLEALKKDLDCHLHCGMVHYRIPMSMLIADFM